MLEFQSHFSAPALCTIYSTFRTHWATMTRPTHCLLACGKYRTSKAHYPVLIAAGGSSCPIWLLSHLFYSLATILSSSSLPPEHQEPNIVPSFISLPKHTKVAISQNGSGSAGEASISGSSVPFCSTKPRLLQS
jgi:hypothetical protein